MKAIGFGCVAKVPLAPEEMAAKILAVEECGAFREVTVWQPNVIALRMSSFSNRALSLLATHFEET